jgi:hypothetical protein
MYFITYVDDPLGDDVSNIKECNWLDLSIIGNIWPDRFLDDHGAATGAQYLGNQNVYYPGMGRVAVDGNSDLEEELTSAAPRLVKQWRKKDFANQNFTMSMKEHTGEDDTHWPLILNMPGEGFGHDMLQYYQNHKVLSEDVTDPFLLDGGGPPAAMEYVPSNLEIASGFSKNIWTGSPVWSPPAKSDKDFECEWTRRPGSAG